MAQLLSIAVLLLLLPIGCFARCFCSRETIKMSSSKTEAVIQSPGYPEKYCDGMNCEWMVQAESFGTLTIKNTKPVLSQHEDTILVTSSQGRTQIVLPNMQLFMMDKRVSSNAADAKPSFDVTLKSCSASDCPDRASGTFEFTVKFSPYKGGSGGDPNAGNVAKQGALLGLLLPFVAVLSIATKYWC